MIRLLKFITTLVVSLIILGVLASVLFVTLVSPNRFKPMIAEQVKKFVGRELTIDGDLSWTFYPNLGVKVGHMQLNNPEGFKQKIFAEIDSATLGVKLLPLFHAQIESNGIAVNGMKLNLIKNANGKTNWQDLQNSSTSENKNNSSSNLTKVSFGLAISNIDISNADINWIDDQAKQSFGINNFELHAKNISLLKSFPIKTAFDFSANNPAVSGRITMATQIEFNLINQMATLKNIDLIAKINQAEKRFEAGIKTNLVVKLAQQKLLLNDFAGHVANLVWNGDVSVTELFSKPRVVGHVNIQPFDVKKWLQNTGQDVSTLQALKNVEGDVDFSMSGSKSLVLKGNLKADELLANKIKVTNIKIKPQMQGGVLQLSPITADFYQGNMQAQTTVNFNTAVPKITLQAKVANVQAEPLFVDLVGDKKIKLTGIGTIDLQVTTQGANGDAISKNLNGTSKFNFNNGTLQGIDVGYLIENANALAHGQTPGRDNTDKTEFGTLTGSLIIRDGVVNNKDLYLNSPGFDIKGNGTINLVNQTINYKLNTSAKQTPNQRNGLQNLYGVTIPIVVTGNLNNPTINLDAQSLMRIVAEQQLHKAKTKIQERIKEKVKNKIAAEAGELLGNLLGQ